MKNETCYTFRTKNQLKKARLDYAFVSPPLLEHIVGIDHHYIDEELTDHSATIIHYKGPRDIQSTSPNLTKLGLQNPHK